MILDKQLLFSDAQALTTTANSTNVVDLGASGRDIGRGRAMRVIAELTTALAGGTSVTASLVESANSDLSSGTTLISGPVVVTASGVKGAKLLDVVLPTTSKRYVGMTYTISGTYTGGAVTSGLVLDTDSGTFNAANTGF